jgi:transposase
VENAIRGIAVGRRNWLFAGSESGGRRAALMYSLIETAKLNGIEPLAYLCDILQRLPTARAHDLDALLPWNWQPLSISAQTDARPAEALTLSA